MLDTDDADAPHEKANPRRRPTRSAPPPAESGCAGGRTADPDATAQPVSRPRRGWGWDGAWPRYGRRLCTPRDGPSSGVVLLGQRACLSPPAESGCAGGGTADPDAAAQPISRPAARVGLGRRQSRYGRCCHHTRAGLSPAASYSISAPVFRRRPSRAALEAGLPIQTPQRSPYQGQRRGWGWNGAEVGLYMASRPLQRMASRWIESVQKSDERSFTPPDRPPRGARPRASAHSVRGACPCRRSCWSRRCSRRRACRGATRSAPTRSPLPPCQSATGHS